MPYTTAVWGEEQAANGLTGTAAKTIAEANFVASGDKVIMPDKGVPFLLGYGMTGDTKPQGCALIPDNSNGGKGYYGPGAQVFVPHGWLDLVGNGLAIPLQPQDSITGQTSSTNVNEGSVLGAHISFGSPVGGGGFTGVGGTHFAELCTVTSAAAVTYNSGAATVYSACTNTTNWYDPEAQYYLLGVSGHLSGATFGGILHVTGLGEKQGFAGHVPGVPINALSAVDFSANQPFTPFLEPLGPISGLALNTTVKLGMMATTAGAVNFVLHMARQ